MNTLEKVSLIAAMSKKMQRSFGRTALMKFAYFLQSLRNVPLGYRFSLYSYGPFDSDVLADLDAAESFGAVKTSVSYYSGGYGYEIVPADGIKVILDSNKEVLKKYEKDLDWIIKRFGDMSSSQLELASTIIYADRELKIKKLKSSDNSLAIKVAEIKPHFQEQMILTQVRQLKKEGMLESY